MIEFDCPRKPVFDHCVFVATPRPAGPLKPDSGHKNRVKSFESEQSISVNPTIITYTTNIEKKKSISSISRANQHLSFEPLYYESFFLPNISSPCLVHLSGLLSGIFYDTL